jgi:hypothetical protein
MASFIYNSFWEDLGKSDIDLPGDTFKLLLVTSSYTPNKDTHSRRDDITNEVANGNGYTTGGITVVPTVTVNTATDIITYTFPGVSWTSSTITAAGAVLYKSRGGASSADELVFYNDFGGNVTSSNATFAVSAATIDIEN